MIPGSVLGSQRMSCLKLRLKLYSEEGDERERHTYMPTDFDAIVVEIEEAGT